MREIWIAFALGVVMLQRQDRLPGVAEAGAALGVIALLLALIVMTRRTASSRFARGATILAVFLLAALAGYGYAAMRAHWRLADGLPLEWQRREVLVTGVVRGLPARDAQGQRFLFDVDGHDTGLLRFPARLRLSWIRYDWREAAPPEVRPGARWRLRVRLKRPHGNANAGLREAEAAWLAGGIRALGYVASWRDASRLDASPRDAAAMVDRLRYRFRERIRSVLDGAPHAGIVIALAIGAQDDIAEADRQVLRATGTSHLVAISGLHIGMVGALAAWLAAAFWRRGCVRGMALPLWLPAPHAGAWAAIAGAGCYAALAGFNVPAQRAWWMLAVACLAYLSGRSIAPSTTLAAALGCVLLADPWAVLMPGFWLSFGAVAVILFAVSGRAARRGPPGEPAAVKADGLDPGGTRQRLHLRRAAAHLVRIGANGARVQYAVMLGLAPFTVIWFGQVPLTGALANAFVIPWVGSLVTPIVLAGTVLPAPLDALAMRAAHALLAAMFALFEAMPAGLASVAEISSPSWFAVLAALAGTGWALMPRGRPLRFAAPPAGALRLTLLDVGQGLAVLAETAHHRLLCDAGPGAESTRAGERIVVSFLRANGIRSLDTLMISHADADHAGGAAAVLEALPVGQLTGGLPHDNRLWERVRAVGVADRLACRAGQRWTWDGVHFAVLWPRAEPDADAPNASSCVLHVSAGRQAALLTGDIDIRVERTLVRDERAALAAEVLVVPHHGSRTSSWEPFVDAVAPHTAWFPLGHANRFGHPHPTVWARYAARGIELARSDRDGAVSVTLNDPSRPDGLPVERYRERHRRYWMAP
ncbi:MAG: DNA internalization-related competence protein ComEC/Rec2 [Burkholderia gladioli]